MTKSVATDQAMIKTIFTITKIHGITSYVNINEMFVSIYLQYEWKENYAGARAHVLNCCRQKVKHKSATQSVSSELNFNPKNKENLIHVPIRYDILQWWTHMSFCWFDFSFCFSFTSLRFSPFNYKT